MACPVHSVRSKSSVTESERTGTVEGSTFSVGQPEAGTAEAIPPEVLELAELRGSKYAEVR